MLSLSFIKIVWLKKLDVFFQIIGFIIMIYCWHDKELDWFAFSTYVMAGVQIVSCLCWAIININKPIKKRRRILQRFFAVITPILLITAAISLSVFAWISIFIMLWLGPILGISYFITTIKEIAFYRGLVHRDAI